MNLSQILAFLGPLAGVLEPILINVDQNQIQPELKALIGQVSSPDLKAFLLAIDAGLDAFAQAEIQKLA